MLFQNRIINFWGRFVFQEMFRVVTYFFVFFTQINRLKFFYLILLDLLEQIIDCI